METFTIEHLSFIYPKHQRKVLDDISLTVTTGEFIVLCGVSGCGKTTLLRQLKPTMTPHGQREGKVFLEGQDLTDIDFRDESSKIGFVGQNPDSQLVTDKVWHELAFGLENLGYRQEEIQLKVAEMASFFGIQEWFYREVNSLSGGQKQLLNLAAIMAMSPQVLILDEPTSQLDPIAASEFLSVVGRVHRELGITVIMTEHRLEEVLPMAGRMIVLDKGKIIADDAPSPAAQSLAGLGHGIFAAMPTPMRVYAAIKNDLACPLTVQEGRDWLNSVNASTPLAELPLVETPQYDKEPAVEIEQAWFKYEKQGKDILKGLSLKAYNGELLAILGGNGTGKSTTLSLISGMRRPYRGTVKVTKQEISLENKEEKKKGKEQKYNGLLGVLPQNPQVLFVKKTVKEDLEEMLSEQRELSKEEKERRISYVTRICHLRNLRERHPYDLSGGEQQRLALAKVLLTEPKILILDEPTKGLDAEFKKEFAAILKQLLEKGVAIIMVSHDIEFCARYANRCALLFDGNIVSSGTPREFFTGNTFYTTAANRMSRHLLPKAITADDVIIACGGSPPPEPVVREADKDDKYPYGDHDDDNLESKDKGNRSAIRKTIASLSVMCFGLTMLQGYPTLQQMSENVSRFDDSLSVESGIFSYIFIFAILFVSGFAFYSAMWGGRGEKLSMLPIKKRKATKRSVLAAWMILLLIPLTIYLGVTFLDDRRYYFISLLVILETMLPFVLIFEGRKPQAREMVVIAVICALAVVGRLAFFMLPQFKPMLALTIIAAVAFGSETGFLVGAMSAFVSNFFYGQGPWTPWQMFACGIIGFLAGILFQRGFLQRSLVSLTVFGALSTFFVYGLIMNSFSAASLTQNPDISVILSTYALAFPFDLILGIATAVFLWLIARPLLEKLDRVKIKYGLIE